MKLTKLTLLSSCFLLLASLLIAEDKLIEKDKFLRINPNITNEALRAELEKLVLEFETERKQVHNYYTKEIDALKEKRRLEITSIKNEFGEKREALYIKYGEGRKKPKPANNPNKIKRGKGKKQLRKSK
ncbi:MAG: hypothetical protein H8E85_00895 [Candidatus Marinimicrobia bacterium]|nr:hypothetical protein [Candidatus Neomarinimicrobiota bacterium]